MDQEDQKTEHEAFELQNTDKQFWEEAFLVAMAQTINASGWELEGTRVNSLRDRVAIACIAADMACEGREGRFPSRVTADSLK